jgi:hypothetical protein
MDANFNLSTAVENWRNELAAQPQLTPDDRRELEKHLVDAMVELRGRGLNDEESFWLAQKRIGQPQQLAEEFEKVDPQKIWRERAFWMVFGLLAFYSWYGLINLCINLYHGEVAFQGEVIVCRFVLGDFLPIMVLFLAQRWGVKNVTSFFPIFKTRWHFAISMILLIVIAHGWQALETYQYIIQMAGRFGRRLPGAFWLIEFTYIGFPLVLLALAIWLLPMHTQPRQAKKAA